MKSTYYVYLLTNKKNGVIYTGITNNLYRRLIEHKAGIASDFTERYGLDKLVYYEVSNYVLNAIAREKQIKSWRRSKKIELIESINPDWLDLSEEIIDQDTISEIKKILVDQYDQLNDQKK